MLALKSDADMLNGAFRKIRRKDRPKLRREAPHESNPDGDGSDDSNGEPLAMMQGGLRTDSSLGFPMYSDAMTL